MGDIGASELLIIGIVLVLLFGASRLPATAKGLGQALRLFKKEIREDEKDTAAAQVGNSAVIQPAPVQPYQQAPIQPTPIQPTPAEGSSASSAVHPVSQG